MQSAYVVTGTMTDERTVTLDEDVQPGTARVRIVIEPLPEPNRPTVHDVLADIWAEQDARGYVPRSREQIDADLKAERDSWDF